MLNVAKMLLQYITFLPNYDDDFNSHQTTAQRFANLDKENTILYIEINKGGVLH